MIHFEKPYYHHFLLVLFFSLLPSTLTILSPTTQEQGEALVKWKSSLAPTSSLNSWSLTNLDNLCNWTGITCNSATSVSEINLYQKQLNGTLSEFGFNSFINLNCFNISDNYFSGPIPPAIENLTQLQYLDLSHNHLNGSIPFQISHLQRLRILRLSWNELRAPNWSNFSPMPLLSTLKLYANNIVSKFPEFISNSHNLTYLDLGNNNFTGDLVRESVFTNYQASISLRVKGREYKVENILNIYTTIDLSSNKFQGEVPKVTGELRWLALLNLSHNSLTGPIPSLLGNMEALQSLDLSSNQLTGAIPDQLTRLTFLEVLNLSENHLTGEIPQKGQFSTFGNDSYLGNLALCGLPLTKKCIHAGSPPQEVGNGDENDSYDEFNWEVILMGYGCGMICGLSMGYIVFTIGKPWWFLRYIEVLQQKLMRMCLLSTVQSRHAT